MTKEHDKKWYKEQAWKIFSKYIRRKYSDKDGYAECVTCGEKKHWKELQAGHFIDSRNNTVLFCEEIVFPQCVGCNLYKSGNKVEYTLFMLKRGYTTEQIEEFVSMKHRTKKMGIADYQELIDKYTDLNVGLDVRDAR